MNEWNEALVLKYNESAPRSSVKMMRIFGGLFSELF